MKIIIILMICFSIWGIFSVAKAQAQTSVTSYNYTLNFDNASTSLTVDPSVYGELTSSFVLFPTTEPAQATTTIGFIKINSESCANTLGGGFGNPQTNGFTIINIDQYFTIPGVGTADCTQNGTYYFNVGFSDGVNPESIVWFNFPVEYIDGEFSKIVNFDFSFNQTKIENIFIQGTSATTTFDVGYNIDINGLNVENRPDSIRIRFLGEQEESQFIQKNRLILPLNAGNATTTIIFNESLDDDTYNGTARFINISEGELSYPFIFFDFTVSGGVVTDFNFETFTLQQWEGEIVITQQPCSITQITGCVINAMTYLFIPNQEVLNDVFELWENLAEVKPFGYIIQVIDIRGNMELNTPSYELAQSPLQTQIFDPLRSGLAIIFWVVFVFYLYNRFKNIDI